MTFKVLTEFEADTPSGTLTLKKGQAIKLSKEEAIPLIEEGKIIPVEKVAYRIYSKILETYLWVVETDQDLHSLKSQGVAGAIYTGEEIQKLKGLGKDSLKEIHKVKEVFENSKVEQIKPRGSNS